MQRAQKRLSRYAEKSEELQGHVFELEDKIAYHEESEFKAHPEEFELSPEDWRELALQHRLKYRIPCLRSLESAPFSLSSDELDKLGLSDADSLVISDAFERSNDRIRSIVQPACVGIVESEELAETLGVNACIELLQRYTERQQPGRVADVYREVAEVRAGDRDVPSDPEELAPLFRVLLTLTQEGTLFEEELAQHFGPGEAKRIWHGLPCTAVVK